MKSLQKSQSQPDGATPRRSRAVSLCRPTIAGRLRSACPARLLLLLLFLLPATVQAQYTYTTDNGAITITKYTGFGGAVTMPGTINGLPVTSIGEAAFWGCTSLTSVTIGNSVTSIGDGAFWDCPSLTGVYFEGNSPYFGGMWGLFFNDNNATVYYLPGTTGWGSTLSGRPAVLWNPQVQTSGSSFGVRTNQFGFTINWASDRVIIVEACTDLANPVWTPVGTNILTGGSSYFSDPQWTNFSTRIYRFRAP